jgi:sulfite reductase alpha subunit-like flavoprotein
MKRWKATVSITARLEGRIASLPVLVDYQPGRSLDIWYKNKRQHVLALSGPDPLRGDLYSQCFRETKLELSFLQTTALVRYVRFAIWSCCERMNTLAEKYESQTIKAFTDYLLIGTTTDRRNNGYEVRFSPHFAESELLLSLFRTATPAQLESETKLIKEFDRRRWGIYGD